ncbi:MAG: S1 family peptidase [Ilumatobacteraceae bacterium]
MRKIISIVLVILSSLSMITTPTRAITYGIPIADAGVSYPDIVSLWLDDEDGSWVFHCSATLIEPQIAITAAHCVEGVTVAMSIEVLARVRGEGIQVDVDASWYHSRYSSRRFANDIAVLHLATPVAISSFAVMAPKVIIGSRTKLLMAGWGVDQNGDDQLDMHKLSVNFANTAAHKIWGSAFNPTLTVAAGKYFKTERLYGGACNGDSGGPLFAGTSHGRRNLVGIVSYGYTGCDVDAPTVFARVSYYYKALLTGIKHVKDEATRLEQERIAELAATPLTATFSLAKAYQYLSYWDATLTADTVDSGYIVSWCFLLDGKPMPEAQIYYGSGEMPYSSNGAGCFLHDDYSSMTSGAVEFVFSLVAKGSHTFSAVITDSYKRVVTINPVTFVV